MEQMPVFGPGYSAPIVFFFDDIFDAESLQQTLNVFPRVKCHHRIRCPAIARAKELTGKPSTWVEGRAQPLPKIDEMHGVTERETVSRIDQVGIWYFESFERSDQRG